MKLEASHAGLALKSASNPTALAKPTEPVADIAREFEALFIKTLLDEALPEDFAGMGGSGQAEQVRGLWVRELADSLAAGRGLGVAQMLQPALSQATGASSFKAESGLNQDLRREQVSLQPPMRAALNVTTTTALAEYTQQSDAVIGSPQDFVQKLHPIIAPAAHALGVSPRILLAQAALETGWGQHMPTQQPGQSSHNLFGVKSHDRWAGASVQATTQEYQNGQMRSEQAEFRGYQSFAEAVADYVHFVRAQPRYAQALEHGGSDRAYIEGLAKAGYATDPDYAARVLQVADSPWLADLSRKESADDATL